MKIDVESLASRLEDLKECLSDQYDFEHASIVADATEAIRILARRTPTDEELEEERLLKARQARLDALDAVYRHFKSRIEEGEAIDPREVGADLEKTIRDFS